MCVSAFLCLNLQVLLTKFWNDDFVLYFVYLVKITVQFPGWGGYFFVVLLPLKPIAYPRPNEVKQRLSLHSKKPAAKGCRFSMKERLNYDEKQEF